LAGGYRVGLKPPPISGYAGKITNLGERHSRIFRRTAHKNRMQGNDYVQRLYRHRCDLAAIARRARPRALRGIARTIWNVGLEVTARQSPMAARSDTNGHTHHKRLRRKRMLSRAYMPKIETTLGTTKVPAHIFLRFISPAEPKKYAIPNPCTECHKDKTTPMGPKMRCGAGRRSPWLVDTGIAPYVDR